MDQVSESSRLVTGNSQADDGEALLPKHDDFGMMTRFFEWSCLLTGVGVLIVQSVRLALQFDTWTWWLLPVVVAAILTADFLSGVVHWFADTWFDQEMPILGRRFLRPFRVHHINPDDILRRDFVDINGDTAIPVIPVLVAVSWLPLELASGQLACVYLLVLCGATLPTNQIHQWAHMSDPPQSVRWLQDRRLILSRRAHGRHHAPPHTSDYCITLGWCNPFLASIRFFPRLETVVSKLTGLRPRSDEESMTSST